MTNDDNKEDILSTFALKMLHQTQDLEPMFAEMIEERFWDLFMTDDDSDWWKKARENIIKLTPEEYDAFIDMLNRDPDPIRVDRLKNLFNDDEEL